MTPTTTVYRVSALVVLSPSLALAANITGSVSMSSRLYVDADLALNAANPWPGPLASLGSGPGSFDYQLFSRIGKSGRLAELWDDQFAYFPADAEHRVQDGVGVHRFPQGFLRADDPLNSWDPDNPAITALAQSGLDRASGRLSNEFGDVAGWHRGEVGSLARIRPNSAGRFAVSSGRFVDHSTFTDNSNDTAPGYRARRIVKESWGRVASEVVDPFARRLSKARWDNRLDVVVRESGSVGELFSATLESDFWQTSGQASILFEQGRDNLDRVYPGPQESAALLDPSLFISTLRLECLIIDPADRPALNDSHFAFLSVATVYQDVNAIFPDAPLSFFQGTAEIVNGDFEATGDFADLDWQFETVSSEIAGFDKLIATVDVQSPWAFNMDFESLFFGVGSLEYDLKTTQNWYTLAVPAPAGAMLMGVALAFGSRRLRRA